MKNIRILFYSTILISASCAEIKLKDTEPNNTQQEIPSQKQAKNTKPKKALNIPLKKSLAYVPKTKLPQIVKQSGNLNQTCGFFPLRLLFFFSLLTRKFDSCHFLQIIFVLKKT